MDARITPDLNDAALFVRVVQTSSFSAAAREHGVPVSTVSRRVARLEAALGSRLLERTTRKLRLTDAGRAYFGHAERAVDELQQGTGQVRELLAEPSGRVRVLAPIAFAEPVGAALFSFLQTNPKVAVELELQERRADLVTEGYDVALVTGKLEETADFVAREVWSASPKFLFASPAYLKARGVPRTAQSLLEHDLIATRAVDGFATWTLLGKGRSKRLTFAPRFAVNEYEAGYRAALAGLGVAMFPQVRVAEDLARKRLKRVLPGLQGQGGGVHLLYRAHRSLTAAVRACVTHLLERLPQSDPSRR